MKIMKRTGCIILVIFMLTLTGCWNYREIESMSIVSGIAIDKGENGYKYHMTFQYVNLTGGSEKSAAKPALAETDGDTIFDSVRNLILQSQKKFYFSDCKIIIFNYQLASEGITPILDWFIRDSEPRITIDLLVSQEEKASDILKQKEGSSDISAFSINKMIENSPKFVGKSPDVAIYQAENMINGKGVSLVVPAIRMKQTGDDSKPEMSGTAVFKEDKLIGFLNDAESQYMLFVQGKLNGGVIITSVNSEQKNTALEIIDTKTSVSYEMTDGQPYMKIKIKVDSALDEENSSDAEAGNIHLEEIEQSAGKTIETGVIDIIKKVQTEYNSDIFGFGKTIYQNNPKTWNELEPKWEDIFPNLQFQVSADVKIKNTAVANPRNFKEGG